MGIDRPGWLTQLDIVSREEVVRSHRGRCSSLYEVLTWIIAREVAEAVREGRALIYTHVRLYLKGNIDCTQVPLIS